MILTIFAILTGITFLLLFYGYLMKQDLPKFLGFLLLFFLGSAIMPSMAGTVTYCDNHNITTSYIYDVNNTLINTIELDNCLYSTFEDHTIGFYVMIVAVLMFILVMFERRNTRREEDD